MRRRKRSSTAQVEIGARAAAVQTRGVTELLQQVRAREKHALVASHDFEAPLGVGFGEEVAVVAQTIELAPEGFLDGPCVKDFEQINGILFAIRHS